MKSEHDTANERPILHPARPGVTQPTAPVGPAKESSVTAVSEQLPESNARPVPTEQSRKAGEAKVAPLQKEYDGLLNQIRDEVDPAKRAQLVVKKGNVTRQIDAVKREHGIK